MTGLHTQFPLSGVIGIVDSSPDQIDSAVQCGLRCVEIRADLLFSAGLDDDAVLDVVRKAKKAQLACLFTYRHADEGGSFKGQEAERVSFCTSALSVGADIIDLEHGTEAASNMLSAGAPMILSHHNFDRMVSASELKELSNAMEAQSPLAVKIIPTGKTLTDAANMLAWVGDAGDKIQRIGFTMGAKGACSRILAIAHGAPVTYASFGDPVAPGQVEMSRLLNHYVVMSMNKNSELVALVGEPVKVEARVAEMASNSQLQPINIPFAPEDKQELEQLRDVFRFKNIIAV